MEKVGTDWRRGGRVQKVEKGEKGNKVGLRMGPKGWVVVVVQTVQ